MTTTRKKPLIDWTHVAVLTTIAYLIWFSARWTYAGLFLAAKEVIQSHEETIQQLSELVGHLGEQLSLADRDIQRLVKDKDEAFRATLEEELNEGRRRHRQSGEADCDS